jgi:uncharacterized YigZ family protein
MMSAPPRYPIPAATTRVEGSILRSRFIATVGHAPTVEEAKAFIAGVSDEFPEANHNCWAYVVGPPGDTSRVGMSDDGEPHGTAGRPMLAVLTGSGIGDVVAVVTRYFGGTKLGKGGLVRAYSGAVKNALAELATEELISRVELRVSLDYALLEVLKRSLAGFEAQVTDEEFGTEVTLAVMLPEERVDKFVEAVAGLSNGRATAVRTYGAAECSP